MTKLSPQAQAVLAAFRAVPDLRDCPSIAAALRAAADSCDPAWLAVTTLHHLYAIADELENSND